MVAQFIVVIIDVAIDTRVGVFALCLPCVCQWCLLSPCVYELCLARVNVCLLVVFTIVFTIDSCVMA